MAMNILLYFFSRSVTFQLSATTRQSTGLEESLTQAYLILRKRRLKMCNVLREHHKTSRLGF